MTQWHIVLVVPDDRLRPLAERVRARLDAAWTFPEPLTIEIAGAEDLGDAALDAMGAAVFVDVDPPSSRLALLTTLAEHSIAVIALGERPFAAGNPYEFAGAIVECLDIDDGILCATLRGILHRQSEVRSLQRESHLAQRCQGGLRSQITKMHEEMHLAAMVQREFLPQEIPSLHGVMFDALWRPAHYVAGDIFDIARLDEDHIGVFLADAAGHGVPAALMTMVIHRSLVTKTIRQQSYRLLAPSEVMAELNNGLIRRQGSNGRFATAVYALVNCRTRRMAIAGAGHPSSKLIRADGRIEELASAGSLLGVFENEQFEQVEVTLGAGDKLLVFSDGFEQAFPQNAANAHDRRVPTSRYHEELQALARQSTPTAMIDEIKRRLDDEAGSLHQVDDLTLICMHAGPLESESPAEPGGQESDERFSITL